MRYFGATDWRLAGEAASYMLPAGILICVFIVDLIDYFEKSDQLLPVTSFFWVVIVWAFLSIPAANLGAYLAFT